MKKLQCATFDGIKSYIVDVESTITRGLPSFSIVGMVSTAITESKERVKSALLSNEIKLPPKRITINLSPSDISKNGSHFDLSIALLVALSSDDVNLDDWFVFGELGLDGSVKENDLLYPLILSISKKLSGKKVIIPRSAAEKIAKIPNITFISVANLNEAIAVLKDQTLIETNSCKNGELEYPYYELNSIKYYYEISYRYDFLDVKGQENAKRAALICAAGMHNIIFEGSPGCGKSMIAKRLVYILPPAALDEILYFATLDTLNSKEPTFSPLRPFLSPHHTSTPASIFGGGSHKAKIGEVGLSHGGILFFDELPHFSKNVLEALREPLEDRKIRISRVNTKVEYDASFLFVGAMNPCPCGNLLSRELECRCSDLEIKRYKSRLSDPFLDRVDLYVQMQSVSSSDHSSVTSDKLHEKVLEAFKIQMMRQNELNGRVSESEIYRYCILEEGAKEVLDKSIERYALTFRSINKVKKVARTIADLDGSELICRAHLLEALSYRKR